MHRLSWLSFGAVASLVVVTAVAFAQDQGPTEKPLPKDRQNPVYGIEQPKDRVSPQSPTITRPVPLPANTRFVILYNESEIPQELVKEFQEYLKSLQNPSQQRPTQTQPSQGKPQDSAQSGRNGDEEREKFREFIVKQRNSTPPNRPIVFGCWTVPVPDPKPPCGPPDCFFVYLQYWPPKGFCVCMVKEPPNYTERRSSNSPNPVPPNTIIFVMGEELVKQLEQADAKWWQENVFAKIPAGGRPEPVALTIKPGSIPR